MFCASALAQTNAPVSHRRTTSTSTASHVQQTNAAPLNQYDWPSFHIISQRNIFNANRSGYVSPTRTQPRVTRVDYFSLRGTMSYEKGRFAIFEGSNSNLKKTVQPGGKIASYKVMDISQNGITLSSTNGTNIDMSIGMQMKREDNGPWSLGKAPDVSLASIVPVTTSTNPTISTVSSSSSSTLNNSTPSASSGSASDVLQRLMLRRQQQNQ